MKRLRLLLLLALSLSCVARAGADGDVRRDVAREHYEAGAAAYERGDWDVALAQFEGAAALAPSPELTYNIGRCHEHLGHTAVAVELYRRFLAERPDAPGAAEVRARIAALAPAPTPAPPPRSARRFAPAIGIGALALVVGASAAALLATTDHDYDGCLADKQRGTPCASSRIDALEARAIGGWVTLGVFGALAVTDAVLWGLAARRPRATVRADGLTLRF